MKPENPVPCKSTTLAYQHRSATRSDLPSYQDLPNTPKLFLSTKSDRRKHYHKQHTIPKISASNYSVFDQFQQKFLFSHNASQPREIASLTKIMTCHLVLTLIDRYSESVSINSMVEVSEKAAKTSGTSAKLKTGDVLSVKSLLYGLMLPSGNDASVVLAEFFGNILNSGCLKPEKRFVLEMNRLALEIGMPTTHFSNPHGLMHCKNLSSSRDICKLACVALRNSCFREIVGSYSYVSEIIGKDGFLRFSNWINTNKLLGKGFNGVKTGVTLSAGPCLCVSYNKDVQVVVVLLNCKSMDDRWVDAKKLVDWVLSKSYFR